MNSLKKRKITAVAVSLLLVAVIVTTGLLCAPNLHKSNDGEDVAIGNMAYNAYDNYGMTRMTPSDFIVVDNNDDDVDDKNADVLYFANNVKDASTDMRIMFPTEIYMDKAENLEDAGYYFFGDYYAASKSGVSFQWWTYASLFGYYSSGITGAGYTAEADENTMNRVFSGYSIANTANSGPGSISTGNDGPNSKLNNTQYKNDCWKISGSGSSNTLVKYTMKGTVNQDIENKTYKFTSPNQIGIAYQYAKWTFGGSYTDIYDPSSYTETGTLNHRLSTGEGIEVSAGYEYKSGITIEITIYDKSKLYEAVQTLTTSRNELNGSVDQSVITAADKLLGEANAILKERKTDQTTIDNKLDELKAFKFQIERPGATNPGWTFGDTQHADGSNTYLNELWTRYNRNIAKYFDVTIVNNIYGQWDSVKTTPISTQTRKVNDAASYDSQGYVRDAGDYTITFTPKDLTCGIEWSTNPDSKVHTMTMTIQRANMQSVTPAAVADRQYTGSAQTYSMSTAGAVVQLRGNMTASNSNLVVKLLKNDPGADNHENWDAADCVNSISFTEVGTHTVYYRIQADNHNAWRGSYTVKITPATVNVVFGAGLINKNADGSVLTYGDEVLSSEQIIAQGVTDVTLNGVSPAALINKDNLSSILTFGLLKDKSSNEFETSNLTNAGDHSIGVSGYKTIANRTQDEIRENPNIVTWDQRINVTLSNEDRAYRIAKKEIDMVWGSLDEQIYDGLGNHRPDVEVKAGEQVSGGEVFVYSTYVLTGAEAGRSEGMAGVIEVDGITYEVPLTDGGNAIWAGSYIVGIQYNENSNYTVSEDTRTTAFEIKQRKLVVNVLDRESEYAQALSDSRDVNAQDILNSYQGAMFEDNTGVNQVYEFAEGTSLAIAGSASRVFELDIVGVPTTSPLGSSDAFYCAGTHTNALVARLRTDNEVDSRGDAVDMNRIRSYDFSFNAGTLTINEAEIRSTRVYMRKTFNGEDQEFALKLDPIVLSGYESIHRDQEVTIKYSTSFSGPFTTDPIKLRNHANGEGVLIYYQIEAANHKTTAVLNFTAYMDRLFLDVTIGNIKNVGNEVYYGDEIPTSNELMSLLDISYESRRSDAASDDEGEIHFTLEDNLQFYIANGGQKVTDSKIGAGLYTLNLEPLDPSVNSLNNYNITFLGNGASNANENAFEISKRPLVIDWRQTSSSNWINDGMHFVYNATAPRIQPVVRPYRYEDLDLYSETSIGTNTFDDETDGVVRNFIDGDTIVLRDQYLGGSTYTAQGYLTERTTLSKQENIKNYVLVNPTATFYIVKRTVEINVFDKTAQYGSAKTVTLGNLGNAGANWEYHAGNTYQFIRDHYMNWKLSSIAIEGGDEDYQNVGNYNIVLEEDPGNDGNVANNYEIIVYRKRADGTVDSDPTTHAQAAIFTISEAEFNLARREFNFDASPRNPDATISSPVEDCIVSAADIKDIIRLVGGTSKNDLTLTMSAPISYKDGTPSATLPSGIEMLENRTVELTTEQLGKWYVWISIRNSNYEPLDITVDINYLTNWISIRLGDKIQANYGDTVMESDELFEELNFLSIQGVMNDEGTAQLELKDALAAIQERGYFTLFVGRGDKTHLDTNESVGYFSVYMEISEDEDVIGTGDNELHFRFIGAEVGKGVTSNVDVYQVIPRPIYLIWDSNISEIYGEHSGTSASHTGYTVMNVKDDDSVGVVIKYAENDAYGNPGEMFGNHVHFVGDYIATLDDVSHQNYRIAVVGDRIPQEDGSVLTITRSHLQKEFRINEREITVTIKDQTLVYGSLDARENADATSNNNIYNFVNASSAYYVSEGSIYEEDIPSDIFDLKVRYTLAAGCNYLDVDTYNIYGSRLDGKIAKNYNVRFVREGVPADREAELKITNANFTIDSMQFNTIFFDGKEHSPLNYNNGDALSYTFAGDADVVFEGRRVYFNANINATESDSGWVLASSERLTFRNAGTHQFAVMVEAPNHNSRIRNDITFTILAVNVNIDMTSQAVKTYGDVIGDGTEKAISDFIKNNTGITYEVTTSKDPWHIDNVADAFIFYVVVGGEQGADGGEGIEVGNFANGVGEYRVYHKFADGEKGNYNVSYTQNGNIGCNAKAFKIVPKEVEVVWYIGDVDNQDIPKEYTYTGNVIGLQAAFEATRYNEDTKKLEHYYEQLVVLGGAELDARETPYTASADFGWMRNVSDNYTLKPETTSFQYKINPREIVVVLKNQGTTYGVENYNFDSTESAWTVGDDDKDEWPSIPNANMVLTLKLPQTSGYVPSGKYDIQAVCNNTNFKVTFTDEEGNEGWGVYEIVDATIDNVPTHMENLTYNGADQNVDIYK
ncbi:MAG: hypothetical protein K2H36_05725, partial [Clostridia bacterium]|nr:hypothetical protein [Clostridia bacterium]